MVRQFADPYAFLRELIQNGIDARATRLDVRVELQPGNIGATQVIDDGAGMSQETLEGPLLTLFSSSKEGGLDTIGRYGVGFISVFALAPEEVQVETWQAGKCFLLRLFRDHRYEIEEAKPRAGSGTTVTLLKAMEREELAAHAARCEAALLRWCRHAERPIRLLVSDLESGKSATELRIDRPISMFGPISLTRVVERRGLGKETFAVSVSAGSDHLELPEGPSAPSMLERAPSFAGFYNRGLTLLESSDPLSPALAGVRFKVVSPCLQHTLSRDDVRRDADFERVLGVVRELVSAALRSALVDELGEAARAAARGEKVAAYAAMLKAALFRPMTLAADEITFPLASPLRGAPVIRDLRRRARKGEPLLVAPRPDAITEALAAAGRPVVLENHPQIAAALRRCYPGASIEEAREAHLLVRERDPASLSAGERAFASALLAVLRGAGEVIGRVGLCTIEGAHAARTAVVIPEGPAASPRLCAAPEIGRWWGRWGASDRLLLNVGAELTATALRRAARAPLLAAHLLGRALLAEERGPISASASDRLLELGGEALEPEAPA
jgi:molecular chaperone HtpG